jgi:hypothetical protein
MAKDELGAYFGNPNIANQGKKARELAAARDVNTLPDPKTYAFVSGLLGSAPDEQGFSVMHPQADNIRSMGAVGFGLGLAAQTAPMIMPIGAGLKALAPTAKNMAYNGLEGFMNSQGLKQNMVLPDGMSLANKNLQALANGERVNPVKIGLMTDDQFSQVNSLRAQSGFDPLPSKEVFYTGKHHAGSRYKDGYAPQDLLKQLTSGLDDAAVPQMDRAGRVNLVSTLPRFDGYASTVSDTVALIPSKGQTIAEAFSVIPKGDKQTISALQTKMANVPPGVVSDMSRNQRMGHQPSSSLITNQDVRNWIAQDNAVKMLGLPSNNTAMDRAAALGFDANTYHGTSKQFDSFDVTKANPRSQYMPGVFSADDPALAENFGDYIMPLLQRKGTSIFDKQQARRAGLAAPEVDTIYDKAAGIRVTNKPENIRSRFAAFDPARVGENNLLGGATPEFLGLLGAGTASGAYSFSDSGKEKINQLRGLLGQ